MGQIKENCAWKVKADKKLQKLLQDTNDSVKRVTKDDIQVFCKHFEKKRTPIGRETHFVQFSGSISIPLISEGNSKCQNSYI